MAYIRFSAGIAIAVCAAGVASAQDFNRTVAAGKRTLVGQFALYSIDTCYAGPTPDAKIGTPPAHGRLDFTEERVVSKAGNCAAQAIMFRRVYYTPNPGFRGRDNASVNFIYNAYSDAPRLTNRGQSYTITVK